MFDRLTLVTAASSEPVSVTEAKTRLRIDGTDDDTDLGLMIKDAVARIDGPNGVGICMEQQTWEMSLDCFPEIIYLPLSPVASITSITYIDGNGAEQTLADTEYKIDTPTRRLVPAYGKSWPSTRYEISAVKIRFVVGYDDVPDDLKQAIFLMVGHSYAHREAVGAKEMSAIPEGVKSILDRYRVAGFG